MATAAALRSSGFSEEIRIYEASNHLGGRCYSFLSPKLGQKIDNGTHMMLKANQNLRSFLEIIEAEKNLVSGRLKTNTFNLKALWRLAVVSVLNTEYTQANKILFLKTICKALRNPHALFVKNTLEETFVLPFISFAQKNNIRIEYAHNCVGYENGRLLFTQTFADIASGDMVIWALPQRALARIFKLPLLPHNPITNVHFLLSPKERPFAFVGQTKGAADWFKIRGNLLSVTISAKDRADIPTIKAEACRIFPLQSTDFLAHTVIRENRATISQDQGTLLTRDEIIKSLPADMIIAGDWTQQNLPCTIEAAITSGFKAAQKAMKNFSSLLLL